MVLTEVEFSLASVQSTLELFNRVSYYKVKESKSYIWGLGIDPSLQGKLKAHFPYTWSAEGIKYLGITLTASTDQLVKSNYTPFINILSNKLQDIAKVELSWFGRLADFKMVILPQLLYLFRTLIIPVPHSFFSTAQAILNKYLWQGRRARCAFKKLVANRRVGVVGHVLLKDYHTAATLAQMRPWFPQLRASGARWLELEKLHVQGHNLYDLLLASRHHSYWFQSIPYYSGHASGVEGTLFHAIYWDYE